MRYSDAARETPFALFRERSLPAETGLDVPHAKCSREVPFAPICEHSSAAFPVSDKFDIADPEFIHLCKDIELLSLFHGFRRSGDGLEHYVVLYGAKLHCVDMEIDGAHDLADQRTWDEIIHDIEQERYDGGGGGALCSIFAAGRNNNDGGPRPSPSVFTLPDC